MSQTAPGRKSAGFTLVEMIVTVGIIVIVISLGLVNFKALGNSSSTYSASRDLLVSDLRLTASKALNQERFQSQEPYGWGVYFTLLTNKYTIFADVNGNRTYDSNETFKTVSLNPEIKIIWDNYTAGGSLFFNSSDGKTYINNTIIPVTPTTYFRIYLQNQNNALVKTITVSPLGVVSY